MNWDDLKYFLAVCQYGSIRAAAKSLDVNHGTVSRRINNFEQALGERLFERSVTGYQPTEMGNELYQEATHLAERLNTIERKVANKDTTLRGEIRITLPELLAQELLMADFAEFSKAYPHVQLHIIDSIQELNLANREADVAFRLCEHPPEYLIGRKLARIHQSCYINREKLQLIQSSSETEQQQFWKQQNWLGWNDKMRRPKGEIAKAYPRFNSKHQILTGSLQKQACRLGMGISVLPCFVGDNDKQLTRIPPAISEGKYDLWILSHPDLHKNLKMQTFVRFMTERILAKKLLIEGEQYTTLLSSQV